MFKLVVLSSVLALVASSAIAPWGLGLGWTGAHLGIAAPLAAAPVALGAHGLAAYNYRGPLSLAPGQPANILAADGRPLDTLSVNLDRAAHYTARAVDGHGLHLLKKRSAPLLGPAAAWSHTARIDLPGRLIAPAVAAPLGAPLGLGWRAPIAPLGLGLGHTAGWGHAGPWW